MNEKYEKVKVPPSGGILRDDASGLDNSVKTILMLNGEVYGFIQNDKSDLYLFVFDSDYKLMFYEINKETSLLVDKSQIDFSNTIDVESDGKNIAKIDEDKGCIYMMDNSMREVVKMDLTNPKIWDLRKNTTKLVRGLLKESV